MVYLGYLQMRGGRGPIELGEVGDTTIDSVFVGFLLFVDVLPPEGAF
jgi:hypothetical protein